VDGGERVDEEKNVGKKRRSGTWRCRTRRSRNRRR